VLERYTGGQVRIVGGQLTASGMRTTKGGSRIFDLRILTDCGELVCSYWPQGGSEVLPRGRVSIDATVVKVGWFNQAAQLTLADLVIDGVPMIESRVDEMTGEIYESIS